jgi:hypothetical protein
MHRLSVLPCLLASPAKLPKIATIKPHKSWTCARAVPPRRVARIAGIGRFLEEFAAERDQAVDFFDLKPIGRNWPSFTYLGIKRLRRTDPPMADPQPSWSSNDRLALGDPSNPARNAGSNRMFPAIIRDQAV